MYTEMSESWYAVPPKRVNSHSNVINSQADVVHRRMSNKNKHHVELEVNNCRVFIAIINKHIKLCFMYDHQHLQVDILDIWVVPGE